MQEPRNRGNSVALILLKVFVGYALFSIVMCVGLLFFAASVCKSGKFKVERPHHPPSIARMVSAQVDLGMPR